MSFCSQRITWSLLIFHALQVFCYALSPSDGSEWRQRISAEAEHFMDVSAMASDAIAELINNNKIQILVNLNGYTKVTSSEFGTVISIEFHH